MRKILIIAIALSLVFVSGSLFTAQADCNLNPCGWNLNPCGWHFPSLCSLNLNPCGWHFPSCGCGTEKAAHAPDVNKPLANVPMVVGF